MTFNRQITTQTQNVRALAEELETAICKAEGIIVSDSLQLMIDSIPFLIAAAEADGRCSTPLFALEEGKHFTVPEQVDPYKSERPEQDWLTGDAAVVFRYCVEAGLLPSLAPYTQPLSSAFKSELVIDWSGTALAGSGAARVEAATINWPSLKTSRVRVPYPEQANIRRRVSRVLAVAPEMIHRARLALQDHEHKALLLCLESSQLPGESFEFESDFTLFCNLFNFPVRCNTSSKPVGGGFERQFTVTYSLR